MMVNPDAVRMWRERLEMFDLRELVRALAQVHVGDGDAIGLLARVVLERLDQLAVPALPSPGTFLLKREDVDDIRLGLNDG